MANSHADLIASFVAVAGMTLAHSLARPGPGKWSTLELIVHLADTDAIVIDRMKRVIAEDRPKLLGADEDAYIARLHPHSQSMEDAVTLLDVGRRQFGRLLTQLPDIDFDRTGTHNSAGVVSIKGMLKSYTDHIDYHLKFVAGKRKNLGV